MKRGNKIKRTKLKPKIRSGMTIACLHRFYFAQLNKQEGVKTLMRNLADL